MKKYIKKIMLICATVLSVIACKEDEIDLFSGSDVLYFKWSVDGFNNDSSKRLDSVYVSFASKTPDVVDSIYNIPVKILGNLTDFDREFKVQVLPTSTAVEGVDFIMPTNVFIPAQSVTAMLPITLLRTETMQNEAVSIKVGLVPNEYFRTDYYGTAEKIDSHELLKYNEIEVAVSDILNKPFWWDRIIKFYLGDYSRKKLMLFATVNNIPIPDWETSPPNIGTFFGQKNVFKAYLLEQKNNGTPVLEDDGTEMQLGPYA